MRSSLLPGIERKVPTTALLLLAAASLASLAVMAGTSYNRVPIAVVVSLLLVLTATILQWFRPRTAYRIAILGGILALIWLFRTEVQPDFCMGNSWIAFNASSPWPWRKELPYFGTRILAGFLLLIATVSSGWRLLPRRWSLRGQPIHQRTWPAVMLGLAGIVIWYVAAAHPYRTPIIVDSISPELRILHITRKGLQLQETGISVFRDRRLYVNRSSRRLFDYRFNENGGLSVLSKSIDFAQMMETVRALPQFAAYNGVPPVEPLREWNDEGWYVLQSNKVAQFTKSNSSPVPAQLVALFHELESFPLESSETWVARDICFGFCYDPVAGLGFQASNRRCRK